MASNNIPRCRGPVCLCQFYSEHWRLNVLDISTRMELATALDGGLGFDQFAERFHYRPDQIRHLKLRAQGNYSVDCSPTLLLLTELESKPGISVQRIQQELEAIQHAAADVIPNNLAGLTLRAHFPHQSPSSGIQHTEPSICMCRECRQPAPQCRQPPSQFRQPPPQCQQPPSQCQQPPPYNSVSLRIPRSEPRKPPHYEHSMHHATTVPQDLSHSSSYELPESRGARDRSHSAHSSGCTRQREQRYHLSDDEEFSWYLNSCTNPHCKRCSNTHCDSCRLENDPEETKVKNSLPQNHSRPITREVRMGPYGSSDPDYISDLHIESLESQMSSLNCSSTSETNNKSLQKRVGRKLCANSSVCEHFVGDMNDTCKTCKKFSAGAIPQNTFSTYSSSRSNSDSSQNRNSWPEPHIPGVVNHNIWRQDSDSALSVASLSPRTSCSSPSTSCSSPRTSCSERRTGTFEQTLYSRISSIGSHQNESSSANVENTTQDTNNVSNMIVNNLNERLDGELHSSSEGVYQNNLDSTGSRSNSNNVTGNLNSEASTSSNGPQNGNSNSNSSAQRRQSKNTNHRTTVFVTYSWNGSTDPVTFLSSICDFCKQLKEAGFRVKLDMVDSEYESLRQNKIEWIDRNLREAEFVIVCITPTYQRDIEASDAVSPRCTQLNARYIYDRLRQEFYQNQSRNRRMVPVLYTEYGAKVTHVPSCMRSTFIFQYPKELQCIIDLMKGHGSYMPA